jgi:hypothetical protein
VPKRPRDPNQLAKLVADIAIGDSEDSVSPKKRVARGRSGGIKGGKARAAALSHEQRHDIAKTAAAARWKKSKQP